MNENPMDADAHWKLKKEVSLPAVVGLMVQTCAIIVFVANLNFEVQRLRETAVSPETIARMQEKMAAMKDDLVEIKLLLRAGRKVDFY